MSYKAFACLNIAIIGNEKPLSTLAKGLSFAGHNVWIGVNDMEALGDDFPFATSDHVVTTTIADAAAQADIIILATSPAGAREAAYLLDDVRKKVIIDVTYMNYAEGEQYLNTLSAIKSITSSPFVVKCFNAHGFKPLSQEPKNDEINIFLAGDNKKAKAIARLVARDLGYTECHDFGSSDAAPLLDEMAICYSHLASRSHEEERISIRITRG